MRPPAWRTARRRTARDANPSRSLAVVPADLPPSQRKARRKPFLYLLPRRDPTRSRHRPQRARAGPRTSRRRGSAAARRLARRSVARVDRVERNVPERRASSSAWRRPRSVSGRSAWPCHVRRVPVALPVAGENDERRLMAELRPPASRGARRCSRPRRAGFTPRGDPAGFRRARAPRNLAVARALDESRHCELIAGAPRAHPLSWPRWSSGSPIAFA